MMANIAKAICMQYVHIDRSTAEYQHACTNVCYTYHELHTCNSVQEMSPNIAELNILLLPLKNAAW